MQIWPAIDLRGGRCVRLQQGDYQRETVFGDNPAEMARHWVAQGAERLHLVDLDGALGGRVAQADAIRSILDTVEVPCQLGGGIRDESSIRLWLDTGLARLVIGTRALQDPVWFVRMCRQFPGRLVLGLDARGGLVATSGWCETSSASAVELARRFEGEPLAAINYTDIARDGMLAGPNFEAIATLCAAVTLPVVASGGVTTREDIRRLAEMGLEGCIVGRALYQGELTIVAAIEAAETSQ
jgi:phosphoribosylformimino-5-aminoimidazole carboxamide ribotide isomerase